jgi:hypothetical protein
MNSYIRIVATVFPRDMVCLRNISVDTLHKGDTKEDDDDDDDDDDNNNTDILWGPRVSLVYVQLTKENLCDISCIIYYIQTICIIIIDKSLYILMKKILMCQVCM